MRYLFSVLLILHSYPASATQTAPAFVSVKPTQSSVVATGDYEDIRIDSNSDQNIDLWVVKKGNLQVAMKFQKNKISSLRIIKSSAGKILDAQYVARNGALRLARSEVRTPKVMNGTGEENSCEAETLKLKKEIQSFSKEISAKTTAIAAEATVSCNNNNEEIFNSMAAGTASMMRSNQIAECLNGPKASSFKAEDQGYIKYIAAKMELDLKKMAAQQNPSLITCEEAPAGEKITAKYTENGQIVFKIPKDKTPKDLDTVYQGLLNHELIHRAGLQDEAMTESIIKVCGGQKVTDLRTASSNFNAAIFVPDNVLLSSDKVTGEKADTTAEANEAAPKTKAAGRQAVSSASAKGAGSENVDMKREIASAEVQKAIPSSEKLAVNSVKMTDEGKQQAVVESQRQTAPVLAMANNAMGAMSSPTLASDESSSNSYSSDSSSSSSASSYSSPSSPSSSSSSSSARRTTASDRYQSRNSGYDSTGKSTSTTADHDFSKGIHLAGGVPENIPSANSGSQMPIVVPPRPANAGTGPNTRTVADTQRSASAGSDASGEVSGGASGGSGTYFPDNGASRKTNANTRGVASSASGTNSSREVIISDFSGTTYSEMKNKLRDRDYQNTLSSYQITVLDRNGSMVGASRGTTVFLDDGSRFVMQRRK